MKINIIRSVSIALFILQKTKDGRLLQCRSSPCLGQTHLRCNPHNELSRPWCSRLRTLPTRAELQVRIHPCGDFAGVMDSLTCHVVATVPCCPSQQRTASRSRCRCTCYSQTPRQVPKHSPSFSTAAISTDKPRHFPTSTAQLPKCGVPGSQVEHAML